MSVITCFLASRIRIRILLSSSKIVRKTLVPIVLWLHWDFLSSKNDVNVPSKSNKQKNCIEKIRFLLASWRFMTKKANSGSAFGSINQKHGSADPDPHQNVMDPEHLFFGGAGGWLCDLPSLHPFYVMLVAIMCSSLPVILIPRSIIGREQSMVSSLACSLFCSSSL